MSQTYLKTCFLSELTELCCQGDAVAVLSTC